MTLTSIGNHDFVLVHLGLVNPPGEGSCMRVCVRAGADECGSVSECVAEK